MDENDFFKACEHNQLPVIEKFLKDGGDINSQDNVGYQATPTKLPTQLVAHRQPHNARKHSHQELALLDVHS